MNPEDFPELAGPLRRLITGFPDVPPDVVTSILADSYITAVSVTGEPRVDRAEELAQLRLEVRTRHRLGWVV
ncbi:MAG TPA: hypothetical protein VHE56_06790 [Mycobacteriales bacterium]|nr:hypothetical protein [Mycobacteriales bacterium]